MERSGKLIVFEGVDGCGKTTLSRALAEHLNKLGIRCDWFSFPGGEEGTLGRQVHDIHHNRLGALTEAISPTSLQLLHIAAHIDAIEQRILPALKQGHLVVLDRFWWSTLVYGIVAGANQASLQRMIQIERLHWGEIRPGSVFLVRRKTPFPNNPSLEATSLWKEYAKLAAREARNCTVDIVDNDGTLDEALARLVALATRGKSASNLLRPALRTRHADSGRSRSNLTQQPLIFSRLQQAKSTSVYDTYWRFAAERQAIFFRKFWGEAPPWTSDPILSTYKFTNAYRASDRTSQYLIRQVIYSGEQSRDEVFFRTMLFKLFNRISTWELLKCAFGQVLYSDYSFERYDSVLTKAMNNGQPIYSAAYIMPSGRPSAAITRKHQMHLCLLQQMLKDHLPDRLAEAQSMGKAFELLRSYASVGDFLAYQYVTDFNYSTLLDFSEMEFVVPGPGARDGIRKCFSNYGGLTEADIITLVAERQQAECERLGLDFRSLWGRPLQLIDCQNLFCEVDKYSRVKHPECTGRTGRKRIKQRYRITLDPITLWYPPKWGLNEQIAESKGGSRVSSI